MAHQYHSQSPIRQILQLMYLNECSHCVNIIKLLYDIQLISEIESNYVCFVLNVLIRFAVFQVELILFQGDSMKILCDLFFS